MMSVGLSEAEALSYIHSINGVSIGCINSPENITLTGDEDEIDALKSMFDKSSIFARKLKVDVAYHSHHMKAIADEYRESIRDISTGEFSGTVKMVSSVTGAAVSREDLSNGQYWVQNMVLPVKFSQALTQITQKTSSQMLEIDKQGFSVDDLLEIGPHSALQVPTKDILRLNSNVDRISYNSILIRYASALTTTLQIFGRLFCLGYQVNLLNVNQPTEAFGKLNKTLPNLPEYTFDHSQIYWH